MNQPADWHLLFGLLALQNGLVSRERLVAAFAKWTSDKGKPIDEILVADGGLSQSTADLMRQMVELHVQKSGDVAHSLAVLSGSGLTDAKDQLERLSDADIQLSIAQLATEAVATVFPTADDKNRSDRFRVLFPLVGGKGGMGEINVAEDGELGRRVALKQIRTDRADDQAYRQKFMVEAEITGNLEHPGIVPIYGLGQNAVGQPFYAMRLVQGKDLGRAIHDFHYQRERNEISFDSIEFRTLINRLIDVCEAVGYAHDRGVLHRDLKPGNILNGKYGETLVIDWGLARPPREKPTREQLPNSDESNRIKS